MNLDGDIKLKAFSLSQEILAPYHKKKLKKLKNIMIIYIQEQLIIM